MTSSSRAVRRACLALLAMVPGLAVAQETGAAPPPEIVVGAEVRLGPTHHFGFHVEGERERFDVGAGVFAPRGALQLGLAGEFLPTFYRHDDHWVAPGASVVTRRDRLLVLTAGLSTPATYLGDRWLWRRLQTDLLAEAGADFTHLDEDLGGGGPGNRTWERWTPLAGVRAGVSMRLGGRFHGFFGLAAFYRRALVEHHVTTVTGRRELVFGDSVGVVVFGGADLRLRR